MKTQEEDKHPQTRSKASEETNAADTLISSFWSPGLWENKFLFFKPPGPWYFVMAALEDKYNNFATLELYCILY